MAKSPDQYLDIIIELSANKLEKLSELLRLTEKQAVVFQDDEIASLNGLLEEKQQIIYSIDKIDDEYQIYFGRLKSVLGIQGLDEVHTAGPDSPLNPDKVMVLKTITSEILKILGSLKELDERNNALAKGVMEELKQKTSQIQTGRQAVAGYLNKPQQQGSYFFDKKIGK